MPALPVLLIVAELAAPELIAAAGDCWRYRDCW